MKVESNIDEVLKRMNNFIANGGRIDATDILVSAVNQGRAKMQFRIFNLGLDANNEPLSVYTGKKRKSRVDSLAYTPYERKRTGHGRQIGKKDLEFYGTLRRSIITANSHNEAVCAFGSIEEAEIAVYQERQIAGIRAGNVKSPAGRVRIFSPSMEEQQEMEEIIQDGLKQLYDRLFSA